MIDHVVAYALPQAYEILPPAMRSTAATAFVLAIGLQESRFLHRRQRGGGPARGFWQFEIPGVLEVLGNRRTWDQSRELVRRLAYPPASPAEMVLEALEHNDALAAGVARLRLWCLPQGLPGRPDVEGAWRQYLDAWRPGRPHRETWDAFYGEAWDRAERLHLGEPERGVS